MQGRKNYSEKLFVSFQLSDRVPKENFYRRLSETLDMQFLYNDTRELYGKTGNPSIDPVVFFKLMLTGYLENITSVRRLMEHCSMRMDILYFIGYDIDEPLPWHSTVSRTRQLYPATLFESLFEKVFVMCIEKGMVAGHTHAVDSAPIKANASIENLELRVPAQSIKAYLTAVDPDNPGEKEGDKGDKTVMTASRSQLKRLAKYQDNLNATRANRPGSKNEKAQLLSNKTHYNPRDPDARISIKPGKARKLNYHCSMSVDAAHGVKSHIQADFADGRDSQYLPRIVSVLQDRLSRNHLRLTDLMADAGYSNGYNYQFLEKRKITGWIPVFGKFRPKVDGFDYNKETDPYTCP
ncbi:transposase, partial [Dyadobacter sp. CY261]|uniref:transposase n=1 Tax=Dyadobacter sp. CY261 TaxID=2907203 RepID=UPI001F279A09